MYTDADSVFIQSILRFYRRPYWILKDVSIYRTSHTWIYLIFIGINEVLHLELQKSVENYGMLFCNVIYADAADNIWLWDIQRNCFTHGNVYVSLHIDDSPQQRFV